MLRPLRKIPKVAFASLAVGSGCDGGGIVDDFARTLCRIEMECNPVEFDYYYESLRACEDASSSYFQGIYDLYADYYGAECAHALFDFYRCYYQSYDIRLCAEGDGLLDCIDELYAYYDACG